MSAALTVCEGKGKHFGATSYIIKSYKETDAGNNGECTLTFKMDNLKSATTEEDVSPICGIELKFIRHADEGVDCKTIVPIHLPIKKTGIPQLDDVVRRAALDAADSKTLSLPLPEDVTLEQLAEKRLIPEVAVESSNKLKELVAQNPSGLVVSGFSVRDGQKEALKPLIDLLAEKGIIPESRKGVERAVGGRESEGRRGDRGIEWFNAHPIE